MAKGKGSSQNQKRKYEQYKLTHQREKNKLKRIRKHLTLHPNDVKSYDYITRLEGVIGKK